jgi:hypothetical protein
MSLSDFVDKLKEQCEEIDDPFNWILKVYYKYFFENEMYII